MSPMIRLSAALFVVLQLANVASAQFRVIGETPKSPSYDPSIHGHVPNTNPPRQPVYMPIPHAPAAAAPGANAAQPSCAVSMQESDPICRALYDQYINRVGKIDSESVDAAITLVAARGRSHGFWRIVLEEYENSFEKEGKLTVRRNLLAVLSKMLERDGWSRRNHEMTQRTGQYPQTVFNAPLGTEGVDRLIACADKVDRHEIDDFVLAIRGAYDHRTKDFFHEIMERGKARSVDSDPTRTPAFTTYGDSVVHKATLFYAAVALAELGDPKGVEWLIEHTEEPGGETNLGRTTHRYANGSRCWSNCRHALSDLAGPDVGVLESKTEWQTWWDENKAEFKSRGHVNLRRP